MHSQIHIRDRSTKYCEKKKTKKNEVFDSVAMTNTCDIPTTPRCRRAGAGAAMRHK